MFKFYDIDKEYVKFLKTIDKQVPNIEYDSNNKFVCGVVLNVDGIKYYAPISHNKQKQQTSLQIFDKEKVISTIRFSFMIPAFDAVLTAKDFGEIAKTDPKYASLLQAEYSYCSSHIEQIKSIICLQNWL
jgi:protein AbiQ